MSKSVLVPCVVVATLLAACASAPEAEGPPRQEMLLAVTQDHQPIRFNAGQPRRILDRKPLLGLPPGDTLAGIDYRAAYSGNKTDDKLTTSYAIDRRLGTLVLQGSREGVQPVVSPNGGQLRTVGALGHGPLSDAALDIAAVSNAAFAALRPTTLGGTRLYAVDLASGHARFIGAVGAGAPIRGLAVEP